jgi:hypothetical protein
MMLWMMKDTNTDHVLRVLACISNKLCSNMLLPFPRHPGFCPGAP